MKILMITSVYKDYSLGKRDTSTNIVNSFVTEWVKQGHEVIVIHNSHCYPRIIYYIPKKIRELLASKMGFSIDDYDVINNKVYNDNGARIYRIKIKKFIPHHTPSKRAINVQIRRIINILQNENFSPDVITGHWASPQMEIISNLKKRYNCRTAVVLHGTTYIDTKNFATKEYLKGIDNLGTRSRTQSVMVKDILDLDYNPFVCYSGVPDLYIKSNKLNLSKFQNITTWQFIYVGRLVAYKNIDATIKALSRLPEKVEWEFTIVGEGGERAKLEKLCKDCKCESKVHFLGKVSRDMVMDLLKKAHIFVMISTNEIFGLSYLEAMAASCITIGSINGGIDGVINNKINGLLCNEGDVDNLYKLIKLILTMKEPELMKIVDNAYSTANKYSDSAVAKEYLSYITM